MSDRIFNFSAGPAALPLPVLERIRDEIVCLPGVGASVLEISHRCPAFDEILERAQTRLKRLLAVPDNYRILFLQGGSRLQFSMIPQNLLVAGKTAEFIVTGSWTEKALAEAQKEGSARGIWSDSANNFQRVPAATELTISPEAAYVHLTANETIQGVQFSAMPETGDVPLVCDASSELLSRPLNVANFGLIFACAQKNCGPAGVTIVVIREDLLERSSPELAGYLNFANHAEQNSRYNTPPTFGIYVFDLVAEWLENEIGGLAAMAELNQQKALPLYEVIDNSQGFYQGHAAPTSRSMMNVCFRLPSDTLQAEFLQEAATRGLGELKGHRSVGGIRASIYNAMPRAGTESLREFMVEFADRHQS